MKDYYENKIAHLKEQIEELENCVLPISEAIKTTQEEITKMEEREQIYGREILGLLWPNFDKKIERWNKDIEYFNSKIRSLRRSISNLEEELDSTRRSQKNQYKTKCSADEGYDDVDIYLIIERNGFIGGTRL